MYILKKKLVSAQYELAIVYQIIVIQTQTSSSIQMYTVDNSSILTFVVSHARKQCSSDTFIKAVW